MHLGVALIAAMAVIDAVAADSAPALAAYRWQLPRGFPEPLVPADNPMSAAKVALGRRLFFETRLSPGATVSCASCHDPARAFTDARAQAVGATGQATERSAMALVNVAYNSSYGWIDPKIATLEAQMQQPLFNQHPIEMGLAGREAAVIDLLSADTSYVTAFAAAFPDDKSSISITNLIRAIACYERTLISGNSSFDRYVFGGEHDAIGASAKHGMELFYSARLGCANCHGGFNFTGTVVHRVQPTAAPAFAHNGLSDTPMRIPTLRNIALTAPYMHDGRFATLDAVFDHYESVRANLQTDEKLPEFKLTPEERRDLRVFLESLTDSEFVRSSTAAD
jgi:cytochrome c peroxidase